MVSKSAVLREVTPTTSAPDAAEAMDYYVVKDGLRFAGTHLLIDIWGASRLDELAHVEDSMKAAVQATGATLLNIDLHHFTPNGGISGVAVLAESHMSIHTWPERSYAALDIFVCGGCDPYKAVPILQEAFAPAHIQLAEHKRGLMP